MEIIYVNSKELGDDINKFWDTRIMEIGFTNL